LITKTIMAKAARPKRAQHLKKAKRTRPAKAADISYEQAARNALADFGDALISARKTTEKHFAAALNTAKQQAEARYYEALKLIGKQTKKKRKTTRK
jgi:hypothetical protein